MPQFKDVPQSYVNEVVQGLFLVVKLNYKSLGRGKNLCHLPKFTGIIELHKKSPVGDVIVRKTFRLPNGNCRSSCKHQWVKYLKRFFVRSIYVECPREFETLRDTWTKQAVSAANYCANIHFNQITPEGSQPFIA